MKGGYFYLGGWADWFPLNVKIRSIRIVSFREDYFADLNHGRQIGVVWNVAHDFLRMWTEATLKCLYGIAKNMALTWRQ